MLSKIVCPSLVVQGEEDEHATPQHARDLAASIPKAELWLVPSARHMLPQEDSELFNPRLLDFLEQVREQEYGDVQ
jgi:pimeloyl-ACP methyl ester carboxylesterase